MLPTRLPDRLLDHDEIRRLSMQSLFENLDSICEGTVVVDREARILWINERYATRLGAISAANAIGRAVEEVIPNSLMREVVTSGQPILIDLLETPDATFVVSRIPLKDEHGAVIGAAGFAFFDQVQSLKPLFANSKPCNANWLRRRSAWPKSAARNTPSPTSSAPARCAWK